MESNSEEPFAEDQPIEIINLPAQTHRGSLMHQCWARPVRPLLRRRWLQLCGLLLLGTFCLALLLRATPGIRLVLLNMFLGSTPSNNGPGFSVEQFYFNLGPAWARLSIDGQPIAHPPEPGDEPPLRLAQGIHQFRWQAAPFSTRTCSITIPSHLSDTCAMKEIIYTPKEEQHAWIVSFNPSLLTLPLHQQQALMTTIQQVLKGLQASASVYPGEHFINLQKNGAPIFTTNQELTATLSLELATSENTCTGEDATLNSCELDEQNCFQLCTQASNTSTDWYVAIPVQSWWSYKTLNGPIIAEHMPDETGGARFLAHLLPLRISWDGQNWHVQAEQAFINGATFMPLACASAADTIALTGNNIFGNSSWQSFSWSYLPAPNPANGCLLILTAIASNGPSTTVSARIVYLHRFGVSLAVNHLAQEYHPEMPHPDAYEVSLAQQIAAQAHIPPV